MLFTVYLSIHPTPKLRLAGNVYLSLVYNFGDGARSSRATVHLMRPLGSDCGAYTSASLPVFFKP